jgi:cation transport ATPase|tara:strand:+ start:451 stop:1188 length:738 start_codon:yes stop_codon:yes gene_type:complete
MKHIYTVVGMTCGGCQASVEKNLIEIEDVTNVFVDLKVGEAIITMNTHIATAVLQKALPEKFKISKKVEHKEVAIADTSFVSLEEKKSKLAKLKPLLIIIFYITTTSVLLNYKEWFLGEFMLDFMGLFYIVFSFFKMLDLNGFKMSFGMYDPIAKKVPFYGKIYPFIETALGLLFLMRFEIDIALVATLVILGITTIGVTKTLLDKKSIRCACLGTALKLPMTEATFIENAIMIVMAVLMLLNIF